MLRKVCHQVEEVAHLIKAMALEDGQHHLLPGGIDKVVGIFDTSTDSRKIDQLTEVVLGQKIFEFVFGDGGID